MERSRAQPVAASSAPPHDKAPMADGSEITKLFSLVTTLREPAAAARRRAAETKEPYARDRLRLVAEECDRQAHEWEAKAAEAAKVERHPERHAPGGVRERELRGRR
jgi:hypothetical protein